MTDVTPFRLYTDRECSQIARAFAPAAAEWSRRWFGEETPSLVFRSIAGTRESSLRGFRGDANEQQHFCGSFAHGFIAAYADTPELRTSICSLMLHAELEPATAQDSGALQSVQMGLLSACLFDLVSGLFASRTRVDEDWSSLPPAAQLMTRLGRTGSGWGILAIEYRGLGVEYLVGPRLVNTIVAPRLTRKLGDLKPAKQAIVNEVGQLRAELGSTMLTIGQFENLAVGDVVRLDQSIDTRVRLVTASGVEVASGHLGTADGYMAVQADS